MPELVAGYPQLADLSQVLRIVTNDNVRHDWPPPGTTFQVLAFPEPWGIVWGQPSEGDAATIWWQTLAEFAEHLGMLPNELVTAARLVLSAPVIEVVGSVGLYPVTFTSDGGKHMRWIRTTFRGTLGTTIEQFQHKFDFGIPGNDPQITPAEALALAEDLAGYWKTAVDSDAGGGVTLAGNLSAESKYMEVGVTSMLQDSPKNADGSGGDLHQEFDTEWYAYTGALHAVGTGGVPLPYEVSCAVTLQTDKRGPRGRGRVYLPPFSVNAVTAGGKFTTTARLASGHAVGALFDAVKLNTSYVPIVVSSREKVLNEITSINVGLVPDSQRRRRRSQDEARLEIWTS